MRSFFLVIKVINWFVSERMRPCQWKRDSHFFEGRYIKISNPFIRRARNVRFSKPTHPLPVLVCLYPSPGRFGVSSRVPFCRKHLACAVCGAASHPERAIRCRYFSLANARAGRTRIVYFSLFIVFFFNRNYIIIVMISNGVGLAENRFWSKQAWRWSGIVSVQSWFLNVCSVFALFLANDEKSTHQIRV